MTTPADNPRLVAGIEHRVAISRPSEIGRHVARAVVGNCGHQPRPSDTSTSAPTTATRARAPCCATTPARADRTISTETHFSSPHGGHEGGGSGSNGWMIDLRA